MFQARMLSIFRTPLAADEDSDASGESMSESDSDAEYEEPADYKGIGYVPGSQWAGPDFTSISGKGWRDLQWKRKWHYLKR